jgi:hypothetical protein
VPLVIPPDLPPPPAISEAWSAADSSGFALGNIDLRFGFSAAGFTQGPGSLVTSLVGWYIADVTVEVGVLQTDRAIVGVGAEVWSGRPLLAELAANTLLGLVDVDADWKARDRGAMARVALHRGDLTTFDPYAVALFGPTAWFIEGSAMRDGVGVEGRAASAGLRAGVGVGFNRIAESGFLWSGELRYTAGFRYRRDQEITYTNPQGEEETLFALRGVMKPPKGFSWVIGAGWRF